MVRTGMWVGLLAAVMSTASATAAPPSKPVVTNKLRFRIPFRFDVQTLQKMNARELQLYASRDRGVTWELSQTITPAAGKFDFQAPTDGEYWFSVRTIDGFGQVHPTGDKFEPGLMVVVDTLAPKLEVHLQPAPNGKVQLTWAASDPNLDPSTLRLESQQPGSGEWEAVSVVPRNSGQTTWTVPRNGTVAVRGSIADLAGNQGQAQTQVAVQGAGEAVPKPSVPDVRVPIASSPTQGMASHDGSRPSSVPPNHDHAAPHMGMPTNAIPARPAIGNAAPGQMVTSANPQRPEVTQERWSNPEAEGIGPRPPSRQRIVQTKKFQLGYKVDDVGPSGVGAVELFITQDNGRKWFRYGEDPDRQSPFEVEVPQDGEYGFAVRVRSGAGLANDPPLPGELPSIAVMVDQTAPQLELAPIQQGQGAELNQISIRWRMQDAHPAEKSISLYYAPSLSGPWEPISGWRPDTGQYAWTVGPGVPSQLYIRIVARDAAGNVSRAETTTPVVVDLSRPTARLVDVEGGAYGPQQ